MTRTSTHTADVVVIRALRGLGDILCAVPSLRLIRRSLPDAHVRFIGVDEVEPLIGRFAHYVDEFVRFPGYPGIPEGPPVRADQPPALTGPAPDLVLQIHGDGSASNGFAASLHGRAIAAHGAIVAEPGCAVATRPYDLASHEIERCLRVTDDGLRLIGSRPAAPDTALEFPLEDAERAEAHALLADKGVADRGFVVMHPGSHLPDRRWPAERFSEVARRLVERGRQVLVTGSREEAPLAEQVAQGAEGIASVAGRLSLGGLGALFERSAGVITNDTGTSHLAAALRTPSVVVFMASDPHRWAPLDHSRHRAVVRPAEEDAAPHAVSPEGLLLGVPSVSQVYRAAESVGIA